MQRLTTLYGNEHTYVSTCASESIPVLFSIHIEKVVTLLNIIIRWRPFSSDISDIVKYTRSGYYYIRQF